MFSIVVPATQVFSPASAATESVFIADPKPPSCVLYWRPCPFWPLAFINLMSLVCFGSGRNMIIFLWPIFNLFTHILGVGSSLSPFVSASIYRTFSKTFFSLLNCLPVA